MANENENHSPSNVSEENHNQNGTENKSFENHDAITALDDMPKDAFLTAKSANGKDNNLETEFVNNIDDETKDIAETENQAKKYPYPKSVAFIISNEFCERFNYYGMRTILVLYLSRQLGYSDDTATVMFHVFTMFAYFLCIFGAILSDSWLGKFKTITYLSVVYVIGSVLTAIGAIKEWHLPATTLTMIGLALIALGSGGIKPCVSSFGGDQFKLPEQVKQMTTFFSFFYFAINSGSLISTTVTPILREDVHCFGEKECYPLAFGVPAILMILSIVIFVIGRPLYINKPPAGNMVVLVSKTICTAIKKRFREHKTNPREHWLDYAEEKYGRQLVADIKVLGRVLVLFLPLPVFWALFDQQGSRWTFQATRMDGDMGSWNIKPDQMQLINPLLILVFIPLYEMFFYPLLSFIGIRRPLQKLTLGGIFAGIAFVLSGVLELQLEKTYPVLPQPMNAQLRVFNGEPCAYTFRTNIPGLSSFDVKALDYFEFKNIPVPNGKFSFEYAIQTTDARCNAFSSGSYAMTDKKAFSLFMNSKKMTSPLYWYEDSVDKPSKGSPLARTLANVQPGRKITWKTKSGSVEYEESANEHSLHEFSAGEYEILVDGYKVLDPKLKVGGVYTFLISETSDNTYDVTAVEIAEPNSVSILWIIPQYVVMTLGEVMFSVTGLEFSYSQAPLSMKSVLSACWLLTVAFGNVIDVIVVKLKMFDTQASEFFLFAGLMFVDMVLFTILAYFYKPNNPNETSEEEQLTDGKSLDNNAFENKE